MSLLLRNSSLFGKINTIAWPIDLQDAEKLGRLRADTLAAVRRALLSQPLSQTYDRDMRR